MLPGTFHLGVNQTLKTDTVIYGMHNNEVTQYYRSDYFDNVQTTILIPVQLSKALFETFYQLNCLDKAGLIQRILDPVFHEYFDMKAALIKPLTD